MAALHMYLNFHASVSENTVEFRLPRHELVCMAVKARAKLFGIQLEFEALEESWLHLCWMCMLGFRENGDSSWGRKLIFVGVKFSKLLRLVFAREQKGGCLEFGTSKVTRWA